MRQIISTKLNKEIRGEFDRKIRGDTNEWLCRVERENTRTLLVMLQRASIEATTLFRCSRTTRHVLGDKFGRIDVGTIILTLTLIETRPRTKSGSYVAHD